MKEPLGVTNRLTSMKKIAYIVILTVVLAAAAWAQEEATDRDPFHSTDKRPIATAPRSPGAAWGRDPFTNPLANRAPARAERGTDARGKALTGIIYSKDIRLAIINGEALREGSSIGDRKLESIGMRSIRLKNAAGGMEEVFLQDFLMRK